MRLVNGVLFVAGVCVGSLLAALATKRGAESKSKEKTAPVVVTVVDKPAVARVVARVSRKEPEVVTFSQILSGGKQHTPSTSFEQEFCFTCAEAWSCNGVKGENGNNAQCGYRWIGRHESRRKR